MAKTEIYVVPQEGRSVPDPARGDLVPAEGRPRPHTQTAAIHLVEDVATFARVGAAPER